MQTQPLLPRPVNRLLLLLALLGIGLGLLAGQSVLTTSRQSFTDCLLDTLPTNEALVQWLTVG